MKQPAMIKAIVLSSFVSISVLAQSEVPQNLKNLPPASDDPQGPNQFSLGYRMGWLLTARFKYLGGMGPFSDPGPKTGTYQNHTYDDGYVVRDSRNPNIDTYTWNWGFNSSSQVGLGPDGSYKSVTLHSMSTPATASCTADDDPELGFELSYSRRLGHLTKWDFTKTWRWGLEGSFNYTLLTIRNNQTLHYIGNLVTDTYALDGLNPYMADGTPYKGSTLGGYPGGGGPLINDSPASRTVTTMPSGATISGQRTLDANVYGAQFGPYLEIPFAHRWSATLSAGLALVVTDAKFSYTETVTLSDMPGVMVSSHGESSHADFMAGYYGGAKIAYHFDDSWSVYAGAQYQDVGLYKDNSNHKQAQLDLGGNVFVSLGISFSF